MKILIAASEAVPFCKTGGLADVAGALARQFAAAGHEVALFLPKYQAIDAGPFPVTRLPGHFYVPVGDRPDAAALHETRLNGVRVYLIDYPKYFGRPALYRGPEGDYTDNDERFIFYARAVLEGAKFVDFKPDIIHCHDWQAALIPAYLKTLYKTDGFYARCASLLTVHNIAYQGNYTKDELFLAGFGWADFTPDKLEYYGGFNFLKAGLVYADHINTVSPTYARETVESADFGRGMEGVLKHRGDSYTGILNGLDTDYWDPQTDTYLPQRYGPADVLEGKAANRDFLRKSLGLADWPHAAMVGMVTRLDPQKGLDLAADVLPEFLGAGSLQLALLGSGDREISERFTKLAADFPGRVHVAQGFDEGLAHRIYAGSDLFLMPSRFEPCGLSQMISMRYGTLPVVTRTGGLADTVVDAGEGKDGSGFVAADAAVGAVRDALDRALKTFERKDAWMRLIRGAVSVDFSWQRSVAAYLELFNRVLAKARA